MKKDTKTKHSKQNKTAPLKSWMTKKLVSLYVKSPVKLQYALARFGTRHIIKKKKAELEHALRH